MVTIRKDNVYRIVTESDYKMIWKSQGFHIIKEDEVANNQKISKAEDALRAKLSEHGINAENVKSAETLQKMLDGVEKKIAEGKEIDTELEVLKGKARESGIKVGGFDTVDSLKKKIAETTV